MRFLWRPFLMTYFAVTVNAWGMFRLKRRIGWGQNKPAISPKKDDNDGIPDVALKYDMIIVGAGASGMFASGAATVLGAKTLLLDLGDGNGRKQNNIGGDCTNSACVPSKAVRSIARMASNSSPKSIPQSNDYESKNWFTQVQQHTERTVNKVRDRETPEALVSRNTNLDIALLSDGKFSNPREMDLEVTEFFSGHSNTNRQTPTKVRVRGKQFIIATGASPVVPEKLEREAKLAGLPLHTYRTLLCPVSDNDQSIWNLLKNGTNTTNSSKKIVIGGGGATACELTQSLARLAADAPQNIELHLVAPGLLASDDVTLQNAAFKLLSAESVVRFHLGNRVESVLPDGSIRLSDGSSIHNPDALLLCIGRKPNLESLSLENAGIVYHKDQGVLVHSSSLRSISSKHVFACGDCASAVNEMPNSRTATQAAWTGYHAVSNAILPRILTLGSKSVHTTVPRVVYTDPELVSVGLSLAECIRRFGVGGFDRVLVQEEGTDRSDMDSMERLTAGIGFVEIRATKVDGRVLGLTACGPTASELANEMSVVIENRLRVLDVAKSLHSYPSHGYLMHRVALSLALANIWGSLEACGPVGRLLACPGRLVTKLVRFFKMDSDKASRERHARLASQGVLIHQEHKNETSIQGNHTALQIVSGLDMHMRDELRKVATTNAAESPNMKNSYE